MMFHVEHQWHFAATIPDKLGDNVSRETCNTAPSAMTPFRDPSVKAAFDAYPPRVRARLLDLRELIYSTASELEGCGQIVECLKWGQPAYLTEKPKSGTTVRLDAIRGDLDGYGIFVHCQTRLIPTLRDIYEDVLVFEGSRGIRLSADKHFSETAIVHCLALALTYHRKPARTG